MGRQEEDLSALLPDDVLAAVLRRVAPRGLAACRCACRSWRALIDGRRLLRADLLPHSLAGFFLCYNELDLPEFLARPGADLAGLTLPRATVVQDHCNGLVLDWHGVLNPATGRRAYLPDPPPLPALPEEYFLEYDHLAFDPAESPHYQVFSVPSVLPAAFGRGMVAADPAADPAVHAAVSRSEWPPSPLVLSVFSSRTGRWEERSFVREGEAAGTVADMDYDSEVAQHSVCWRGALYVHRESDFVFRISLLEDTYRVIKPPKEIEALRGQSLVTLGRSQKGVYIAFIDSKRHLCVWTFDDDARDKMDWKQRYRCDLSGLALATPRRYGRWILQNANNSRDEGGNGNDDEGVLALAGQETEWDSDDEDILGTEDAIQGRYGFTILGFHPYKEIVFLHTSFRGLAYHLKSSKLEDLDDLYPKNYNDVAGFCARIENAFPYTPCWMGEL
ncbi:unnamed protein product [Urochloa decumbens]|uniref:F-box domain-containing protein n=1 Tax=Urochloa decumbens TaxID=240449 RepID=A0ABC8XHZ0_9POAL